MPRRCITWRARTRLRGVQLVATDVDWSVGAGPAVEGPVEALLLLLTGRAAALDRLSGPGLDRLDLPGRAAPGTGAGRPAQPHRPTA